MIRVYNEHVPSPSGCGTTLVWYSAMFDADIGDAQELIEREYGCWLDASEMAELLGYSDRSAISQMLRRGQLPEPFESPPGGGALWTSAAAAKAWLSNPALPRGSYALTWDGLAPCGTYVAAQRHKRRNEPMDEKCRDALNTYRRSYYQRAKAREAVS